MILGGASRTPNNNITQWMSEQPFKKMLSGTISGIGFTGHEHSDEVGLIHMNGRIYDPKLARFVQADPIIQDPLRVQSLNRYSYVWNNPLNATDPSGFTTRGMTPSEMSGDPIELDDEDIPEVILYGFNNGLSDYNDSISDNSYSVEWSGDGYSNEPANRPEPGLYGDGNAQKVHEAALLLWPGYDFGTCINEQNCSGADWFIAAIGTIPYGKSIALGMKGAVKGSTQIAVEGGKHAGQLKQFMKQTPEQLKKTIGSFDKQIAKHEAWIKDPASKVENFNKLRLEHQQNLIHHWQQDIARHQELKSIAQDVLKGLQI